MSCSPHMDQDEKLARFELIGLFKSLVNYFADNPDQPMYGDLSLTYGQESHVFGLSVFSKWHRYRNTHFHFYSWESVDKQKALARKILRAIEADDFEAIIALADFDHRTTVQRYIDRSYGPYICPECGRKQHDPLESIEIMTDSTFTIVGGCDECINRSIQDMYHDDLEAIA